MNVVKFQNKNNTLRCTYCQHLLGVEERYPVFSYAQFTGNSDSIKVLCGFCFRQPDCGDCGTKFQIWYPSPLNGRNTFIGCCCQPLQLFQLPISKQNCEKCFWSSVDGSIQYSSNHPKNDSLNGYANRKFFEHHPEIDFSRGDPLSYFKVLPYMDSTFLRLTLENLDDPLNQVD